MDIRLDIHGPRPLSELAGLLSKLAEQYPDEALSEAYPMNRRVRRAYVKTYVDSFQVYLHEDYR